MKFFFAYNLLRCWSLSLFSGASCILVIARSLFVHFAYHVSSCPLRICFFVTKKCYFLVQQHCLVQNSYKFTISIHRLVWCPFVDLSYTQFLRITLLPRFQFHGSEELQQCVFHFKTSRQRAFPMQQLLPGIARSSMFSFSFSSISNQVVRVWYDLPTSLDFFSKRSTS